jgi:hypothetical protein
MTRCEMGRKAWGIAGEGEEGDCVVDGDDEDDRGRGKRGDALR